MSGSGDRALAELAGLVNGDEAKVAAYARGAAEVASSSAALGGWSVLVRPDGEGGLDGFTAVSTKARVAFVIDYADPQLGDGLRAEVAGVDLGGASVPLADAKAALLADLEVLFVSADEAGTKPATLGGTLAPLGLGSILADALVAGFRALAKAPAKEATVEVKAAAKAAAGAAEESTAGSLVSGASKGSHAAVSAGTTLGAKTRPSMFADRHGPLGRALPGKTLAIADGALALVRAKQPAQTIALDISAASDQGFVDAGNIAARMKGYLEELAAAQKAAGKATKLDRLDELRVLDVTNLHVDFLPPEAGRLFARSTGASHVAVVDDADVAQRVLEVLAKPFRPFKEVAGGFFYYLNHLATEQIAVVTSAGRSAHLFSGGRDTAGMIAADAAVDHATIVFLRKDIRQMWSTEEYVARIVRLLAAGKRVVIIDGAASMSAVRASAAFQALPAEQRALLDAI